MPAVAAAVRMALRTRGEGCVTSGGRATETPDTCVLVASISMSSTGMVSTSGGTVVLPLDSRSICATIAARRARRSPASSPSHAATRVALAGATTASRASAISRAVWKRRAGSRCRARITMPSRRGSRPLATALGGSTSRSSTLRITIASLSAEEEALARERLPQHDARRVHVRAAIDVLAAAHLLGRHVRDLALELTLARRLDAPRRLRDAEVEDTRHAVGAHQDVLRG